MNYLFYDFETTGADPACDRPVQFAALRTDAAFNPIADPIMLYAQPSDEILMHPAAARITGILPSALPGLGALSEVEFAARIQRELRTAGTCAVGFNNLRFDAELLRHLFWRNLREPYGHEWQEGNSRFDVLDCARALRALRPEGVNWPVDDAGLPTLKLEALTAANGIPHEGAHDALADVRATRDVLALCHRAQPNLVDYLLRLRHKQTVIDFVDHLSHRTGFVHVSPMIPAEYGNASVFANFGVPNHIKTQRILWDLRADPTRLLDEDAEALAAARFVRRDDPSGRIRLPIKMLHINRAPLVSSIKLLNEPDIATRWHCDLPAIHRHQATVAKYLPQMADKLQTVMGLAEAFAPRIAECALYDGFIERSDRACLDRFSLAIDQALVTGSASARVMAPAVNALLATRWQDARLRTLVPRFVARHWPSLLSEEALGQWQGWVQAQVTGADGLPAFFAALAEERAQAGVSDATRQLLDELEQWGRAKAATQ